MNWYNFYNDFIFYAGFGTCIPVRARPEICGV